MSQLRIRIRLFSGTLHLNRRVNSWPFDRLSAASPQDLAADCCTLRINMMLEPPLYCQKLPLIRGVFWCATLVRVAVDQEVERSSTNEEEPIVGLILACSSYES